MDAEDQLPEAVRFLSRDITSRRVLRAARLTLAVSLVVLVAGVASVGFGVIVDMYLYASLANVLPLLLPLVLYEAMAHQRWSHRILKLQGWIGSGVAIGFIVADSVILGYLCTVYSLCYGDRNSSCEQIGHNKYSCTAILPGITSSELVCDSKVQQIFGIVCVMSNLVAFLAWLVYLVMCRWLKSALSRAETRPRVEIYPEAMVVSIIGRPVAESQAESSLEVAYPQPACSIEPCS